MQLLLPLQDGCKRSVRDLTASMPYDILCTKTLSSKTSSLFLLRGSISARNDRGTIHFLVALHQKQDEGRWRFDICRELRQERSCLINFYAASAMPCGLGMTVDDAKDLPQTDIFFVSNYNYTIPLLETAETKTQIAPRVPFRKYQSWA